MRRLILRTCALCFFTPVLLACAQDAAVNDIKLGMTLQEAQAKLPPGLQISTPKADLPPRFTVFFAQRTPPLADDIDNEGFTVEAVDGKVAYIKRIVTYSPDKAPDREAFKQSLTTAYGPVSPSPPDATPALFPIWMWNHDGQLLTRTDFCPVRLNLANGATGFYRPVLGAPASGKNRDGCNVVLSILLDRRTDRIPYSKLDWVEYTLSDYSKFLTGTDEDATADKPMK
jgi:hypothetical protein